MKGDNIIFINPAYTQGEYDFIRKSGGLMSLENIRTAKELRVFHSIINKHKDVLTFEDLVQRWWELKHFTGGEK